MVWTVVGYEAAKYLVVSTYIISPCHEAKNLRKQNIMLKNVISKSVTVCVTVPIFLPIQKVPGRIDVRPENKWPAIGIAMDVVFRTRVVAVKFRKAVVLPKAIAPSAVFTIPTKIIDSTGHDSLTFTLLNRLLNGTALSRASAHQVRLSY
jgi:hypothetical protein